MTTRFDELSQRLNALLDQSPADAIQEARAIALDTPDRLNLMSLKAAVLVNGGNLTGQQDAITEGLTLYRDLYAQFPVGGVAYNLGNALVAAAGTPPDEANWLGHQEQTIEQRAEARRLFWQENALAFLPHLLLAGHNNLWWSVLWHAQAKVVAQVTDIGTVVERNRLTRLQNGKDRLQNARHTIERFARPRATYSVGLRLVPKQLEHENLPVAWSARRVRSVHPRRLTSQVPPAVRSEGKP